MLYEIRMTWMKPEDPPLMLEGNTAGQAKYLAFLQGDYGCDFGDFLRIIESCRKTGKGISITENPQMGIGDLVIMEHCPEAWRHSGRIWSVIAGPQMICGAWVVWLAGYTGAFACDCLKLA